MKAQIGGHYNKKYPIFSSRWSQWSLSVLLALAFVAFVKFSVGFVFESVDDYRVMFTVAGYYTGEPFAEVSFMNYLFTSMFCLLYRICNWIPWYGLYTLGIVWLSITIILFCAISSSQRINVVKLSLFIGIIAVVFGMFLYPTHHLQFTVVAGIIGAAAIVLLLSVDWKERSKNENIFLYILSVLCLFLSYLQRPMSGKVAIAFWCIAFAYHILEQMIINKQFSKKRIVYLSIAVCILVFLLVSTEIGNLYIRHYGMDAEYISSGYNSYRAEFQDYIRPNVSYDEVQVLAESVGWNRDMWDMLNSMFYFDSRWNFDTVKTFVDAYNAMGTGSAETAAVSVSSVILETVDFYKTCAPAKLAFVAQVIFLLITVVAFAFSPRKTWLELLTSLGLFGASAALSVYLQYTGRLILRAVQCVLFCATFSMMILTLKACVKCGDVRAEQKTKTIIKKAVNSLIACSVAIAIAFQVIPTTYASFKDPAYVESNALSRRCVKTIEEYAISNPENVYFFDFSFGGDPAACYPFAVYKDAPTNLLSHGGWLAMTSAYQQQLALNDLPRFSAEDYLNDNVYFLTRNPKKNPKNNFHTLLKYLDHTLGSVYAETVEVLPDEVYVIKFRQSDVVDGVTTIGGYTRYYDENGIYTKIKGVWGVPKVVALYPNSSGVPSTQPETEGAAIQYWINAEGTNAGFGQ